MPNKDRWKKWWAGKWAMLSWSIINKECKWCKFSNFRWEMLKKWLADKNKWWQGSSSKYPFNNQLRNGGINWRWKRDSNKPQSVRKLNKKLLWIVLLRCSKLWWMIPIHVFKIQNFSIFLREFRISKLSLKENKWDRSSLTWK